MALDNLIHVEFTDDDIQKINQAISQLNEVLNNKVINLSPEERRQYGSIADKNKVLVDKVKRYMQQNASTIPHTIDKSEFDSDYKARTQLEGPMLALSQIMEKMSDTKVLLDHDNYVASVSYYRYIKFLSSENEPGITTIYQDLKKHYQGSKSTKKSSEATDTNTNEPPVSVV